jgi:uncharacterized protein YdeI (YjbR/CyaY-like superfamily)
MYPRQKARDRSVLGRGIAATRPAWRAVPEGGLLVRASRRSQHGKRRSLRHREGGHCHWRFSAYGSASELLRSAGGSSDCDGRAGRLNGALPFVTVSAIESTPELLVPDPGAWERWLDRHHAVSTGVRLVLAKRGATTPTRLTHSEALEVALMFGWIDGQLGKRDDATWTVRFTPRRSRGPWSKRNVGIAERLIGEGRMRPAGLAEVERARADGRWEAAYRGSASISVPEDLAQALAAAPAAAAAFNGLSAQNRYAILYRLTTAKRAETRARRLEQFVDMLARGETIHPQRPPS